MTSLEMSLLGPWRISHAERGDLELRRLKGVALLAYLAVEAGQAHSRASLLGLLWPELSEADARNNLRVTLSQLRKELRGEGDASAQYLIGGRNSLQFNQKSEHWLDVAEFQALIDASAAHAHESRAACAECRERLGRAAALYRGEFMAGFHLDGCAVFDEWLFVQRERHHVKIMQLLGELANAWEQAGEHRLAEKYARRQIEIDPLWESAQRQLMSILRLQGQRNAALVQYEVFQALLAEELGVEPEAETLLLAEQIRSGVELVPQAQRSEPATEMLRTAHNLPENVTPFIGRERELAQLGDRFQTGAYRLISIAGIAGIGKTRLAVQAARENRHLFPDGAFFVALAAVQSSTAIATAIAATLEIPLSAAEQSPRQQLVQRLRGQKVLLVLDNLEHLLDDSQAMTTAELLLEILHAAPGVTLLVTSQERLNLQAEDLIHLSGLALPADDGAPGAGGFAAIRLFCDRAYRLRKSFKLTDENTPHVVRICRLVEGMPLAIELAASWIREFEPQDLAGALEQSLDTLTTLQRDVVPRHRSIRAAFEYSWQHLTEPERELLGQLALFRGGFDLGAAAAVADATPIFLTGLRHKSLIRGAGSGRYSVHELLRQFALEKLAEQSDALARAYLRHSNYYLSFVGQRRDALYGKRPHDAVAEIRRELDNVVQAWRWSVEYGRFADLVESGCLAGLARFYEMTGLYFEGERVFAGAVAQSEKSLRDTAHEKDNAGIRQRQGTHTRLLIALSEFFLSRVKLDALEKTAGEAMSLAADMGDADGEAHACLLAGLAHINRGDNVRALSLFSRGLTRAEEAQRPSLAGVLLRHIGNAWRQRGNLEQEASCLTRALELQRTAGNRAEEQTLLIWLGMNHYRCGEFVAGRDRLEQALALSQAVGDPSRESKAEFVLGLIETALGDYVTARGRFEKVRLVNRDLGDRWQEAYALAQLAAVNGKLGHYDIAVVQAQEAVSIAERHQLTEASSDALMLLGYLFADLGCWGEARDTFARSLQHWHAIGQQVSVAESQVGLAYATWRLGDHEEALALLDPLMSYLECAKLDGAKERFRVWLMGYQILTASEDDRAGPVLRRAHDVLQAQAERMDDAGLRCSFLEKVAVNRQLLAEYRRAKH
jgi:predicted ATPase/DNA-binding SARP family transcriptional activator